MDELGDTVGTLANQGARECTPTKIQNTELSAQNDQIFTLFSVVLIRYTKTDGGMIHVDGNG